MADQAALQEAIQRARQLAAKISQNAPAVKRPASELDDHRDIGTVKVTLAYEKPAENKRDRHRSSSNHRDRDRDRDDSRDAAFPSSGNNGNIANNNNNNNNNNFNNNINAYTRASNSSSSSNPPSSGYGSMLSGSCNYSSGSADERIEIIIPHAVIGLVIGKGGENIKRIQNETGATVRVDPNTVDEKGNKVCTITGTKQAVDSAHSQVSNVIENAAPSKRPRTQVEGSEQYRMKIPASRTGAIIGKGGDTIKSIKQQSGCDIELDKGSKDCGPDESVFIIRGTQDKILKARSMIEARLSSRGGRDGDNSGRSNHHSAPKGVATGANAAPVAQFTDLPANYPAAGQQNSTDVNAAWAAYFAQYSNYYTQTGAQPGAPGLNYAGQNFMGTPGAQPVSQSEQQLQQQQPTQQPQPQPPQSQQQVQAATTPIQQDYTDQWIEFYIANGRPDYAEQIIEMKKQQQLAQKQQQSQPPQ